MESNDSLFVKIGLDKILNKESKTHHLVFVEAPAEVIGPELSLWGEASWWPPKASLKLKRKTFGDLKIGTKYDQKFQDLFALPCELEVTKLLPGTQIERTFVGGALRGAERISVEGRYNGTKVSYELRYKVPGLLNKIIWLLFVRHAHSKSVRLALENLKAYVEKKVKPAIDEEQSSTDSPDISAQSKKDIADL